MIDALYIAATGMQAEQNQLENISNNLSNINTTAYKAGNVSFDDLLYKPIVDGVGSAQSANNNVGMGTAVTSIIKDFSVGDLQATQRSLDIALQGNGFIEVDLGNGEYAYTRSGNLAVDTDGYLTTAKGYRLSNNIQLPPDARSLKIDKDGTVTVQVDGKTDPIDVGQIEISMFMNPTGLKAIGENLYLASEASGTPIYATAGENGASEIAQGFLEGSNVDMVAEMMNLVVTQRAYQVNSQIIRAADQMLEINNNLRS